MNKIMAEDIKVICSSDLDWKKLDGKTFLVTGANGFIPSYIIETLLYLNDNTFKNKSKIIGLARNHEKTEKRFKKYLKRDDLSFIFQDVCIPVNKIEVDYVIHAASQASPKYYGKDPIGTFTANAIGTYNLLKNVIFKEFIFISSSEVYGKSEKQPISEDDFGALDPAVVRSCYAEGKRAAETLLVSWKYQYGIKAKIVRPFHTYGPGISLDDGRVYADFVSCIVKNKDIILNSEGKDKRAFCYITDFISGFFTVLIKGDSLAYNIGNDDAESSIIDLANTLVSMYPEKKLKVVVNAKPAEGYLKSKVSRNCPDTTKLRKLGWKPQVAIDAGFKRMVESNA
ncbi:MAG: NAD-dependent epimerase/dehydratase family protein [archaeon]